jgi:hypothetical protein
MLEAIKEAIKQNLPDWQLEESRSLLPGGGGEEWQSRVEIKMIAPSDVPRTGIAGIIQLNYADSENAIKNFPQVVDMTKQRTLEALPDFLLPGEFAEEESLADSQRVIKITLPLTIMEDTPHTHVTGAYLVQRDSDIFVAFGALLENAEDIARLIIDRKI